MNEAIRHRGPDAEGVWQHGPCALGHRRLSIIDLSAEANQPMCNEDGSVALVVNGEIYNFPELRQELLAKGHAFRSQQRQRGDPPSVRGTRARLRAAPVRDVRLRALRCAREPAPARPRPRRQEAAVLPPPEARRRLRFGGARAADGISRRGAGSRLRRHRRVSDAAIRAVAAVGLRRHRASCRRRTTRFWRRAAPPGSSATGASPRPARPPDPRASSRTSCRALLAARRQAPAGVGRPARRVPLGRRRQLDDRRAHGHAIHRAREDVLDRLPARRRQRAELRAPGRGTLRHRSSRNDRRSGDDGRASAPSCGTTASRSPTVPPSRCTTSRG